LAGAGISLKEQERVWAEDPELYIELVRTAVEQKKSILEAVKQAFGALGMKG